MNLTGKGTFKRGNTEAKAKKGLKHKSTIIKEKLGIENIYELKCELLETWTELLRSTDKDDRKYAAKEISKYVFTVRKEVYTSENTFEDFLKDLKSV